MTMTAKVITFKDVIVSSLIWTIAMVGAGWWNGETVNTTVTHLYWMLAGAGGVYFAASRKLEVERSR